MASSGSVWLNYDVGNQCGQTPILPFAALALAALATGVVATALAVRAYRESGR